MNTSNYYQKIILTGISALIISMAPMALVGAATTTEPKNSGIAMSPVKKRYEYEPGTTNRDTIKITNVGNTRYSFKMYAEPYSVKNENYETDFLTVRKNTDFQDWVTFDKTSFTLAPGESLNAGYTVVVPPNAIPGGHYGVIFAETLPQEDGSENVGLIGRNRVGAPVFATVKGDYKMGGKFLGIKTPGLQFKSPLKSELDVENTGSSHFVVDTVFAVSDAFNNRKFTMTNQYDMLPQSVRKIPLYWEKSPNFGLYKVTVSAKFLDQETTKTSYVLMAPLAYYMVFVIALLVAVIVFVAKHR